MNALPKLLMVDDEKAILDSMLRHLRTSFNATTCTHPNQALDALKTDPSFSIIMSDLKMPGMDGIKFLSQAKQLAPDAVRLLLTGHADMTAAIIS